MATDNFDIIRRYAFDEESGIQLNDQQENMLKRWNFVIECYTCRQLTKSQIVQLLMETYVVSMVTAYSDIGNAEALFGYSTPLNKRFRIGARINFIEEKIQMLYKAKKYLIAAKLEASLVRYYEIYPELKQQQKPQVLNFIYNGAKPLTESIMPVAEAEYILMEAANNE